MHEDGQTLNLMVLDQKQARCWLQVKKIFVFKDSLAINDFLHIFTYQTPLFTTATDIILVP